jgi:hypothetical protein
MRGGEEGCQAQLVLASRVALLVAPAAPLAPLRSDFSPIRAAFAQRFRQFGWHLLRGFAYSSRICSGFSRIASNMYVNQY